MKAQKVLSIAAIMVLAINGVLRGQSNTFPPSGSVGIGTTTPKATLHLNQNSQAGPILLLTNSNSASRNSVIYLGAGTPGIGGATQFFISNDWTGANADKLTIGYNNAGTWAQHLAMTTNGYVGIGTTEPKAILHLNQNSQAGPILLLTNSNSASRNSVIYLGAGTPGIGGATQFFISNDWTGANVDKLTFGYNNSGNWKQYLAITNNGDVGIGTTEPQAKLDVAGTTRTGVLEITGGSDLAEPFEIEATEAIKPGMVVAIDPNKPGQLRVADKAYDHTVAGIISGANGVNPGLTMKQEGTVADGSFPVSLTGRVYCWVDASFGAIKPGDLLTTSDSFGHAMKVTDHAKAQGAVIGKAMSVLEEGKGLVLVLVSLQ